jgi:hypothetical protein
MTLFARRDKKLTMGVSYRRYCISFICPTPIVSVRRSSTVSALAEFGFIPKGALRNPHGVPQKA